jgi:SAM-dependent MidA family methyltransferase
MTLPDLLRAEIERRGPIPFRDFMERALYHPEHGYYTSGRAAIGRGGDFFTNVSVGPLFGRLLARQFEEIWQRLGCPRAFTIVEQGAHRGDFARDVLAELQASFPAFRKSASYVIVEPSARARAAQRKTLGALADGVRWFGSVEELPSFTGVHFSNELIDAFPAHLVKWTGAEWVERHVARAGDTFAFVDGPLLQPDLQSHLERVPPVPPGYHTEVNLEALAWLDALSPKLERGAVLAVDYGFSREEYCRPERTDGTLSAYSAHRREPDPLARPGEIDLTAHVDFTTLAERAEAQGLRLAGFTDQHHFIVGLSRLHFSDSEPVTPAAQKELRTLQTLMHPAAMGRAFKAICLSKGLTDATPLAGFHFASDPQAALGLR